MRLIKERFVVDPNHKIGFINNLIGSGLYSGYFPFASGTVASLIACLIFFIPGMNIFILGLIICVVFLVGIVASSDMMKKFGKDPHEVVIDEFVGMWVTGLFIIFYFDEVTFDVKLIMTAVAFLSFRFFDIIKFQPAKYFDEIDTPIGIMMDDVISAIYAGIVTFILNGAIIGFFISNGLSN